MKDKDLKVSPAREFWINGHLCLIDEADAWLLNTFKWYVGKNKKTFYLQTRIFLSGKSRGVSIHRFIMGLRNCMVDHRNRNGLDNRRENLRFCSAKQNSCNRVRFNKLGYRGVYKPSGRKYFAFQIQHAGKRVFRRGFKTAKEAAIAYDLVSKELHGEFGIRNFKD